ncbi:hypothetical protein ELH67_10945 [Rhizobium ruizarguesonis]|uniref:hypothetical protein n=1 Tax=Rhizobium ruizarguesonis TaxID=2081791 RepID=UPI0010318BAC|nr:hypothetical protein [Rhizobium ruizarguesonis]TAZ95016.1 hypothetical protein ELH67_10945 [Rhizobium ruizarguesonis]TBA37896.1 hypothetical protein ELH60_10940 [Rhizobium ruizarguesonis]TBC63252.1 hypothetical protein ELH36_10950 [Rhizobium ruizarguesonis]
MGRTGETFAFRTSGKGRPLELVGPAAWWRNFSELSFDNSDSIVDFLRRRGDPFGQLSPTMQGDTGGWKYLSGLLKLAASCWTTIIPPTSLCTDFDNGYVIEALLASPMFDVTFVPHVAEIRIGASVRRGLNMHIIPKDLGAYMVASAVLHLENHVDMAVCEQCRDWFVLQRRGTQFCSPSCRAAHSTSKKERR